MSEPGNTDPAPQEPIDARFEPAPDAAPARPNPRGPGWAALGIAGILSAGVGGLIGTSFARPAAIDTRALAPASVVTDVDQLAQLQRQLEARIDEVAGQSADTRRRLDAELEAIMSGATGSRPGLAAMAREIGDLRARLEAMETRPATGTDGPEPAGESGAAEAQLAVLAQRLARLEQADASAEEAASPRLMNRAVSVLQDEVELLQDTQTELARALETRGAAIASLTERVAALESVVATPAPEPEGSFQPQIVPAEPAPVRQPEPEPVPAPATPVEAGPDVEAAALAVSAIESASLRGRPFAAAQARLDEALPDEPAVVALAPFAETGAPTLPELRTAFEAARKAAIAAGAPATGKDGWSWLRRATDGLVTVRPTDAQGQSVLSRLDAAEAALRADDLSGALTALSGLTGAEAGAVSDWVGQAQARLALDAALAALKDRLDEMER